MKTETETVAAVLARVTPLTPTCVPLVDSLGRFSAEDLIATRPLPPFDNSAMDGYAVQVASGTAGARLHVIGEQPAGHDRGLSVGAGEAIRIFTGAPVPLGADAVVMQEDVMRDGETIVLQCAAERGEFIRRRGSDLSRGQKILSRGEPIAAQTIGLLGAQGLAEVAVGGTPRVAVVATGDELARPGETPVAGQIFESNSVMLHALARAAGAKVEFIAYAPDQLESLTETLRQGAEHDALIISGGVSVGDHDLVKPALHALGASVDVWRVAIKPGKPFLFGRAGSCLVFGLPGNTVSAFVTFLKFVRPALRQLAGAGEKHLGMRRVPATLGVDLVNEGDRPHYFRGTVEGGIFSLSGRQESHALYGLSRSNALVRLEPGASLVRGEVVAVELWD